MRDFWLPEHNEPRLTLAAERMVVDRIMGEGVGPVSQTALDRLQNDNEPLGAYLDELGFDLNRQSDEGFWPERVLKIGASLTRLAYHESGYPGQMDEGTLGLSIELAQFDGIPRAYLTSVFDDFVLKRLMGDVFLAPDFRAPEDTGYLSALDLGAGCVRYHMRTMLEYA